MKSQRDHITIEGRNPVTEALRSSHPPTLIYVESNALHDTKIKEIIAAAKKNNVEVRKIGRKKLHQISQTKHAQGVIAIRKGVEYQTLTQFLSENPRPFIVMIREALYEYNLGAVIRTAECAGADAVIIPPKVDISPQAVRTSMGATEHIHVIKESFFNALKLLQKSGISICAVEVNAEKFYFEEDLTGPMAVIIGGEDKPLTSKIQSQCNIRVKIPLKGKINSLNMSVAAGIIMYEKLRQDAVQS